MWKAKQLLRLNAFLPQQDIEAAREASYLVWLPHYKIVVGRAAAWGSIRLL